MLLELTHETVFEYTEPVSEVFVEFRQTPLTDNSQHLLQHRQRVNPGRPIRQYADCFGNTVSYFNITEPVERIEISFDSVLETFPSGQRGQGLAGAPASPEARTLLYDYLRPTPLTEPSEELLRFARPLEALRGEPPEEAAETVCGAIHESFRYEGEVTDVSSPVSDILREGAGVCQDFAHLMLATCRHLGLPARYVSGYVVLDDVSEVSASHAWCEVFDPERGWLGFDPTHRQRAGERYVCLGIGRDYRDVPPNCGIFRGSAAEKLTARVSMKLIASEDLVQRARVLYPQARTAHTPRGARKPGASAVSLQTLAQQQQQQQ